MRGQLLGTTADAAIGELKEVIEGDSSLIHDERLLNTHLPFRELILNDCILDTLLVGEEIPDEGGLTRAQIPHQ